MDRGTVPVPLSDREEWQGTNLYTSLIKDGGGGLSLFPNQIEKGDFIFPYIYYREGGQDTCLHFP